jgi:uncharacterized GH25 family protein
MNLQELIALACRTAARPVTDNKGRLEFVFDDAGLERFAEVVAAAEREACAKVCEDMSVVVGVFCAAAIRARSKT